MTPIGHIRSEFSEKFGIPKQPNLAPSLEATLVLEGEWAHESCWRGLEDCSHLWVIFLFHQSEAFKGGTVRPPVLGGGKRIGVFSTRSPHRPNPIGLSLVKRGAITQDGKEVRIRVTGHDFLDRTPILDLKPYIDSYDRPRETPAHWSDDVQKAPLSVTWQAVPPTPELKAKIEEVIRLDPRPRNSKAEQFAMSFAGYNVVFCESAGSMVITDVTPSPDASKIK